MYLKLPWHISPSKPWSQTQLPTVSSHVPWFEQVPSPGQSNSYDLEKGKYWI